MKLALPTYRLVDDEVMAGVEVNSATTGGNVDITPGQVPPVYVLTNAIATNVIVGVAVGNSKHGDTMRIVRNSATAGAGSVAVKSGTAAGGTLIKTIQTSANGHVDLRYNGSAWIFAGSGGTVV